MPSPHHANDRGEGPSKLQLATPAIDEADAVAASRAYGFPYPQAYAIQLDLMRAIFAAIERGQVGIFESPTGTGKSLSLICAAFTWLRLNAKRALEGQALAALGPSDEPKWVLAHDLKRKRRELTQHEDELKARIQAARKRRQEREARLQAKGVQPAWKKKKVKGGADDDGDDSDAYLASDFSDSEGGGRFRYEPQDDTAFLSAEVKALMEQMNQGSSSKARPNAGGWIKEDEEEAEPETKPKIIFTSRTHSQLSQFVGELRKTEFGRTIDVTQIDEQGRKVEDLARRRERAGGEDQETSPCARSVSLGSRKQMCINEAVQRVGAKWGAEAMNERCLELGKGGKDKKRCEHLPTNDEAGKVKILEFRDEALGEVRDIEDLVELGRERSVCPYYAVRYSAKQAELVTLPYNLLLQGSARESLGISLKDSVIIVDEAHNLIDTILNSHTVSITSTHIRQAAGQVSTYLKRFGGRLRGTNEVHLRLFLKIIEGLEIFAEKEMLSLKGMKAGTKERVLTSADVIEKMGGALDQINLVKLEWYLKESQIARKVSGYADKQAAKEAEAQFGTGLSGGGGESRPKSNLGAISAMHALQSFVLSLANRAKDGRVLVSLETGKGAKAGEDAKGATVKDVPARLILKYQLLNPSHAFAPLVEEARAIVLAGGTMEPISDFTQQLLPTLPKDRFATFSCGHIIPAENLLAAVVPSGPKGVPFHFKFDKREDPALLDDLGAAITNYCNVVSNGVVVFLPSYGFLDAVTARWKQTGALSRMGGRKEIFYEPREATSVDAVLASYTQAAEALPSTSASASGSSAPAKTGALLFAVVGAKLSEGINFSDRLARAVIMVGMPYANAQSPELVERMSYVREQAKVSLASSDTRTIAASASAKRDEGHELYVNLCMKAVNQSIGRAIRHRNDYAALILLDRRYGTPDIRARLPGWIRNETKTLPGFGPSIGALGAFFRAKRAAGAQT